MKRLLVLLSALSAVAVAAVAIGATTKNVSITKNGFVPSSVTIRTGDTVTWTNKDTVNHQVVADNGHFASPILRPNQTYSRRFDSSGTFRYRDALKPSLRGTVIVQGPAPSVSIAASQPIVVFGSQIQLAGAVSNQQSGETVKIFARPLGQASFAEAATVQTTTNGGWGWLTSPTILTEYKATWKGRTSATVTTAVRPRIGFGLSGGFFRTKVTAARSFARRFVYVQRLSGLGQWVNMKKVFLNSSSAARFRLKLRRGRHRLRIFMTVNQAGPGYLAGFSRSLIVRRR